MPSGSSLVRSGRSRTAATAMLASLAGLALCAVFAAVPTASATALPGALLPARAAPQANPRASLHPSRAFKTSCFEAHHQASCNRAALADINKARAKEKRRKLRIPKGFYSMSTKAQLASIANRERNVRGLSSMGVNAVLNVDAQLGAASGVDPTGPPNYSWGSNISWGYETALAADFGWMYDDGTHSPNVGCPHAGAPGCWGHRDNILVRWRGKQGEGVFDNRGTMQMTELFVDNY